ncbi:hypothetical protein DMENIID0001_132820 [Sergentomyia squamirostris]
MHIAPFALIFFVIVCAAQESTKTDHSEIDKLPLSKDGEASCSVANHTITHGLSWTHPTQCVIFYCYDAAIIDMDWCEQLLTTPGKNCKIVPIKPNLDFPYCCPKVICDDN